MAVRVRCGMWGAMLVLAVGGGPAVGYACSVCGGSAMGTDPGAGFNVSLLFLMAMPYVVVGAIGGWLLYTHRRASGRRRRAVQELASVLKGE